ncbi:MAG: DeoR/GlpR transcriptional regulator [Provencibacterium sp.]|jgi:DeoR/GlpR family transcriptional regulator of sugar metabolism|nr:DeoR/GlpR transcriptional regulator [Provencibacterium sp.]
MFAEDRCEKIMDYLRAHKSATIEALCRETFCSPATVRRDLIELERMGLLHRRHGGAAIATERSTEYAHAFRNMENREGKLQIAALVESFLCDGLSLFLDSSSTVLAVCPLLGRYKNLTVVTNGLFTAQRLTQEGGADTFLAGGHIKPGSASVTGELAVPFLESFKADLCLVSCRGADVEGAYEADLQQALIKKQMLRSARAALLLCDHSKLGRSYFYKLAGFSRFEAILTDRPPQPEFVQAVSAAGSEMLFP